MKTNLTIFCAGGRRVQIKLDDGGDTCGSFKHVIDGEHFNREYCESFYDGIEWLVEEFEDVTSPEVALR